MKHKEQRSSHGGRQGVNKTTLSLRCPLFMSSVKPKVSAKLFQLSDVVTVT